jgi:hypothetical protein
MILFFASPFATVTEKFAGRQVGMVRRLQKFQLDYQYRDCAAWSERSRVVCPENYLTCSLHFPVIWLSMEQIDLVMNVMSKSVHNQWAN